MINDIVMPLVVAVVSSGALFSFVQFLITLHFSRKDKSKEIESKLDELADLIDRNQAVLARTHILRFADEQQSGVIKHSKDYFQQTIADIDTYENYCKDHPDFSNGLTVLASQYIKDEFMKIYTKGENQNGI